eukprot:TRINITY_DN1601_c0_g1_i1.p1 TRINITY_DN1601_c0_g1~~TRINITY_DN1601_c0_g1_i1.p1  ORF type:complete len:104 (-),score=50.21 TRINITY_DN1601_c0_g1_i1:62-373(-)
MVHSYGLKSGTRHLFAKKFRKHGIPPVSTILNTFKVGDYVDVVADSAVRAGMPHKYYHGRTGIIWNVTPRGCLLYTSDAADDLLCVDLGGRRIIKKKKQRKNK